MPKAFVPLESNPEVLSDLAHALGVAPDLEFHDVYSLTDPDLLAFVPRPTLALLLVFPVTDAYEAYRLRADAGVPPYEPAGDDVLWVKQTIRNACGTYALLHSCLNSAALTTAAAGSDLVAMATALRAAPSTAARAAFLEAYAPLETKHAAVAQRGDTAAPDAGADVDLHYVAFVKNAAGALLELDGRRAGPIVLDQLAADEDVLSAKAVAHVQAFIEQAQSAESGALNLSFSLVALGPAM
ncbi:uncharacterized protein V1510DRAFT_315223 [Dipodascopsis tothii]|uniref:uncharacterized protein n=1 Tax=Dipodascopsis tothii TaxID=44089 RepID=UPI0034CD3581